MGLLDSVLGMLGGGQQGGGGNTALLNAVVGMLANNGPHGGGVGDLIGKFQQGGLGDVVSSWIGKGQNMPVSADQLQNVLGSDMLGNVAKQLGVSHGEAAGQLSQMLPEVLDKLTPHGNVPQGGLGNITDLLGQLMKR
jgi:uncharacterized protein YidB (DUF937 family)